MYTIAVRTTQNVFIHYPLASVGDRILGYIIDLLIYIVYLIAMVALLSSLDIEAIWLLITLLALPYMFYKPLFEILMDGQTPGKRAMNIKVVRIDGTPATLGGYILRWLFGLFELNFASGLFAMLAVIASGKGQRIGDMVAGTTVVKLEEEKTMSAQSAFISPEVSYEVIFPQAVQLNPADVELIQRSLEINRELGNSKPMLALTEKVKNQLGIRTDFPPVKFLYTLIKDYHHLSSLS